MHRYIYIFLIIFLIISLSEISFEKRSICKVMIELPNGEDIIIESTDIRIVNDTHYGDDMFTWTRALSMLGITKSRISCFDN